ncbi:MAG: hypothetical protein Q8P80_04030 [Candidatus Levybacteria bacterium]|nr:hypothetical protein [Candidatus Levybacteria bacterium]
MKEKDWSRRRGFLKSYRTHRSKVLSRKQLGEQYRRDIDTQEEILRFRQGVPPLISRKPIVEEPVLSHSNSQLPLDKTFYRVITEGVVEVYRAKVGPRANQSSSNTPAPGV